MMFIYLHLYVYMHFTFYVRRCYHTGQGNVRCSPLSGGHNTKQTSLDYAYGAGKEAYATESCPSAFKYLGRTCTMEELFVKQNFATADKMCAVQFGMVYYSPTKEQNHIFAAVMEERVCGI